MAYCVRCKTNKATFGCYCMACSDIVNREKREQRAREESESRRLREERERQDERDRENRRFRERELELQEEAAEEAARAARYQRQAARDAAEAKRIAGLKTFTCSHCEANFNEEHGVSAVKSPIGKPLCEDCLSALKQCIGCNSYIYIDDKSKKITPVEFKYERTSNEIKKSASNDYCCSECRKTKMKSFFDNQQLLKTQYEKQEEKRLLEVEIIASSVKNFEDEQKEINRAKQKRIDKVQSSEPPSKLPPSFDTSLIARLKRFLYFTRIKITGKAIVYTNSDLRTVIQYFIKKNGGNCDLNFIDVSNIRDFSGVFSDVRTITFNGDISKWDVSNAIIMTDMFKDNRFFNGDISNWNTSNVTDMKDMFYGSAFEGDISNWNVSKVVDESDFNYETIDEYSWTYSSEKETKDYIESQIYVKSGELVKRGQIVAKTTYKDSKNKIREKEVTAPCNGSITRIITILTKANKEALLSMSIENSLFALAQQSEEDKAKQKQLYQTVNANPQNKEELKAIIDQVEKMGFSGETPIDLNFIDVSRVTDMSGLFENRDLDVDISKWDVSHVTNMSKMFQKSKFYGNISNWNVSNVENMDAMFAQSSFEGYIGKWNVSRVKTMEKMFYDTLSVDNLDKWDVSNVTNMKGMFQKVLLFGANINNWKVSDKAITDDMFSNTSLAEDKIPKWYKK